MRLSNFFLPLLKDKPANVQLISHSLMLRAGMIRQVCSGIYTWLPLGILVLQNLQNIIRTHLNDAGCLELLMPYIQPANLWIESGRYDSYGKEMLRFSDRHKQELLFGPTNEELITDLFRQSVQSYKDLPKNFYQIQWKFRDEIRPRFGIMRGREFLMKDAYSFDIDEEGAIKSYWHMYKTYLKIFRAVNLAVMPLQADSGSIGGNLNHEFHVLANTGESTIYYDLELENILNSSDDIDIGNLKKYYAVTEEKHKPENCLLKPEHLRTSKGIEVGHIFYFGTKYSAALKALIQNQAGELVPVAMGSYGIGVSRLIAAIIEVNNDEHGIIWPPQIAPFQVSLLNLTPNDSETCCISEKIYQYLTLKNITVLYDDTSTSPGVKLTTHDLIGSPWQIIIGSNKLAKGITEVKCRSSGKISEIPCENIYEYISAFS